MSIRIIDNKKIDITNDEWDMYQQICRSYDRPNFKGESLFSDLFETDDAGMISFLRPPSSKHISMEVFMFVIAIMTHQHLRVGQNKINTVCARAQSKIDQLDEILNKMSRS